MSHNHSLMPFQPITVLPEFKPPPLDHHTNSNNNNNQRRTPSPAETSATISESFSTTASHNAMNMMIIATTTTATTTEDDSPVPGGLDASSHSSPGSASDHMGVIPNSVTSNHHHHHIHHSHLHANNNNNNIRSSSGGGGSSLAPNQDSFVQPLFPGSSVLAAFDAGHPNLYGHSHPQPLQPQPQQLQQQQQRVPPSIPTSNMGVTVKSPVLARRKGTSSAGGTTDTATTKQPATAGAPPGNRRQSRLQRNRESARLSRKRRKQYLELLEERVDQLSETLDGARRQHVANAVTTFNQKRIEYILQQQQQQQPHGHGVTPDAARAAVWTLENHLSRTNEELMIATTFSYQQLKSFAIPPSMQFTLWLTLQTDTYFRGGRTASERLSAARIGERMLSSGTESAAPSQSMWPLFCNEIGLSYDQEEKLRAIQRTLIQDQRTWVDRHTAFASRKVIQSAHDATQALTFRAGQRERSTMSVLSNEQRIKMMQWSLKNRDRVAHSTVAKVPTIMSHRRHINPQYHLAANLYILNEQLQLVLLTVPRAAPLLIGAALKRLSHRPSFEALGASDERSNEMSRDGSYPSSGSLKRNASEMSIDGDDSLNCAAKAQVQAISPVDAQATALPMVQQALHMVQDLLPPEPPMESMIVAITEELHEEVTVPQQLQVETSIDELVYNLEIPMPAPVISSPLEVPPIVSTLIYQAPAAYTQSAPSFGALQPPHAQQHVRKSSFLPAHLSVVPEELWPDEADEFLLDMIEGDWGIGEGIDMDLHE